MKPAFYGLLLALQFLTRVPIPVACPWTLATSRWAVRCYPLVGMLLGALMAAAGQLFAGLPAPLLTLLLLSLWVALSGGLHLDGLMDVADALGSNTPLEKRWAIMKDPHVGSFAIIALLFQLAWKGALLWAWLEAGISLLWLVAVLGLGRLAAVALLVQVPAARKEGLAWSWQQHLGHRDLLLSMLPLALLWWLTPGWVLALGALLFFLLSYGALIIRAFKGINGDIVGAAIEGGELWLLLVVWLSLSSVTG
ncbi:adenosylcobinamide-GDP ribazoletransferase [Halomonas salipaludis]|uniref:Adenosylcobinamide-GDP ribazoletransferase n=1 Tax=Halomonas salipaludis TaxID=2032625 RepID=A0A2A2EVI8_9GAMM|nr:adenosylcobinamide-GDP ribazoletransferase [Halomonas salipaludis]PAU76484.1 adenosylcobinamide-GDP ribazoletransferase [Halomonas salipaludis]